MDAVNLRYPIGTFTPPESITPSARAEWLDSVAALPSALRLAIGGLSDAQLDTPYRDGGWTARQVVHHLADSHINSYTRFRLALTEQEPTIKPYDEKRWVLLRDAASAPTDLSLALLEALHARWVLLMRSLDDEQWRRTFRHPEFGVTYSLHETLASYAWHGRHHLAHIQALRTRKGW